MYHVLHNATRNAVKHGAKSKQVVIQVQLKSNSLTITVENEPGRNHFKMLEMQELYGKNWLLDANAASVILAYSGVGAADSTFQGCRDMQKVAECMPCTSELVFHPDKVRYTLSLHGICVQPAGASPKESHSLSDFCQVRMLCADDQNPPRLQFMAAVAKMGIPIQQPRTINDVTEGIFRDETHLKLFGRCADEVRPEVWCKLVSDWSACPAVIVLDQNIAFGSVCVFGTDICKQLRQLGFGGVIAIRSGDDTESDKKIYLAAGAISCHTPVKSCLTLYRLQALTKHFLRCYPWSS